MLTGRNLTLKSATSEDFSVMNIMPTTNAMLIGFTLF